jgi:hypothetical protein
MWPDTHAFMSAGFNSSRSEIDADRKRGHRYENSHTSGPTSACNPQPKECDVTGHECGENFAEREKADCIDGARGKRQRVKQQIANADVLRKRWR